VLLTVYELACKVLKSIKPTSTLFMPPKLVYKCRMVKKWWLHSWMV